jgi:serine/threonine protein kinase
MNFIPHPIENYIFLTPIRDLLWLGSDTRTSENVLIRIIAVDSSQSTICALSSQIAVLRQLSHPLFARFREVIEGPSFFYLVSDPPAAVSLRAHIAAHGPVTEPQARKWYLTFTELFRHHFDISSLPFLLTADTVFVDADCNVTQVFVSSQAPYPEAPFRAPEVILGQNSGTESATWGAAVFLYFLITGAMPFQGKDEVEIERNVINTMPSFPDSMSADLVALLQKMFAKNPAVRITMANIAAHPWMREISESERKLFEPMKRCLAARTVPMLRRVTDDDGRTADTDIGRMRLVAKKSRTPKPTAVVYQRRRASLA